MQNHRQSSHNNEVHTATNHLTKLLFVLATFVSVGPKDVSYIAIARM